MSKPLLFQLGIGLIVLIVLLIMFKDEIFEPPYKDYMLRMLYVSAKERQRVTGARPSNMQERLYAGGLEMTPVQFHIRVYVYSFGAIGLIHLIFHNNIVNMTLGLISLIFVPRFVLEFLQRRRLQLFRDRLPNALDAIIRGAKAGLTVSDCIQLVATDSAEPIKSEFRHVVQNQRVGMTLTESFETMADRMLIKETRLLSFAINIQQQTGGNISEILENLAHSIRSDNTMRDKAKTVTTEGKTTAILVSTLPIITYFMINAQYPEKVQLLFDTFIGNMVLIGMIFWMSCGIASVMYLVRFKV